MLYWANRYRRRTRCLSWRWNGWRLVRCTWPYWHARYSHTHYAGHAGGRFWRVCDFWRPGNG